MKVTTSQQWQLRRSLAKRSKKREAKPTAKLALRQTAPMKPSIMTPTPLLYDYNALSEVLKSQILREELVLVVTTLRPTS
jgi:hypothetical protein